MKNIKYLVILVLVVGVGYVGFAVTKKNLLKPSGGAQGTTPTVVPTTQPTPNFPATIGDFLVTDKEICKENGKPLVYFFGLSSCPHCVWEKPVAKAVFDRFRSEIIYREDFDSQNYIEVFQRYSDINPGYVPFLVLGCKYVRVGAGERLGKDETESKKLEEEALSTILCKLTGGKPAAVCDPLKEKISEIK